MGARLGSRSGAGGGAARPGVGDEAGADAAPARRPSPIGGVGLQLDLLADGEAGVAEGPGADGQLARREIRRLGARVELARQDVEVREVTVEEGVRRLAADAEAAVVDHLHRRDVAHVGHEGAGAVRDVGHPLDGEGDVVRSQRRAVVEADSRTQLEFPGGLVQRPPGFGQQGAQRSGRILRHQRVEDLPQRLVVGRRLVEMGVQRVRSRDRPDGERAGAGGGRGVALGEGGGAGEGGGGHQPGHRTQEGTAIHESLHGRCDGTTGGIQSPCYFAKSFLFILFAC